MRKMKLSAGERYTIADERAAFLVTLGRAEVYAVTSNGRRLFLMEIAAGEAVFPSMSEVGEVTTEIYALCNIELSEIPLAPDYAPRLLPLMRRWFGELVKLPWLRWLADRGDDVLRTWLTGSVLEDADSSELVVAFADNEDILSTFVEVRLGAQDSRLISRMAARVKQKRRRVDETIARLLGEDPVAASDSARGNAKLEETVLLVRTVAHHLGMPVENITLNHAAARKMEPLDILRRLIDKGSMTMRPIKLEDGWHKSDCGTIIGFLADRQQLAALLPQTQKTYRMVTEDNSDGVLVTDKIAATLGKEAFLIYPGLPAKKIGRMDFLKFIARHTWKTDATTLLLASLAMGLIPLITPIVTETVFRDILPILDRKGLGTVTQVVLVAGFATAALSTVRTFAVMRLVSVGTLATQAALLGRILKLPIEFFRRFQAGNLAERISSVEMAQMLLSGESVGVLLSAVCSFWSLLLMCYYSAKLTGIALCIWLVYVIVSGVLLSQVVEAEHQKADAKNKTAGMLSQIFTGLATFRTKGAEEQAYHLWGDLFATEFRHNYRSRRLKNYGTIISAVEPIFLSLVLYYYGLMEMVNSAGNVENEIAKIMGLGAAPMTAATFIAFQAAFTTFNASLAETFPVLESFSVLKPVLDNLLPFLEEEPESSDERADAAALSGAIEVRNLTFGYREGQPVLRDISFRIAAGEHIAIVGKSGCGKSTLIRLLLGFETPQSGAVYYDRHNLAELSLTSVRSQMGVVLQNGQIMSGRILDNIIGMQNLTIDDAWAAAQAAGIADDIRDMPMGMHTIISEGATNLSGGQRQRLLLARALALKPAIIICDEGTSALDNRTQAIVTKSLDELHTTQIIVAHRLSTIRHADRIIVLDGGRIVESGTYDELVARDGLFASFVKRQTA